MKYIQLYRNGQEMIASDGVMKVDGRFNTESIKDAVRSRNANMEKNFPNSVATSFAICTGRMWSNPGKQITL